MPVEFCPATLVGGGLLIWAALRARSRLNFIARCFGISVVTLIGSQALAVATGLTSGEHEPTG